MQYFSPDHFQLLTRCGLDTFDALWNLPLEPLDAPNNARGGKSQVFLLSIPDPSGPKKFIVKRQHNYNTRTMRHPFSGVPTFRREFENIRLCRRLNIPTVNVVYYAQDAQKRAILVTEYLEGCIPLHKLADSYLRRAIPAAAELVRTLHDSALQHRHLHPKHIFLKIDNGDVSARLIDIEAMRLRHFRSRYRIADLATLNRRHTSATNTDRLRFLLHYLGAESLDPRVKQICRKTITLTHRKKGRA